ncbi:MAG: methyltransferase domain-containing protein [Pseudomonadota bacterium]
MTSAPGEPADWRPDAYRLFEDERTQPARDLVARIASFPAKRIVDLGCGPGNSTRLLKAAWPDADVTGVDASPEMVATAKEAADGIAYRQGDIAAWAAADSDGPSPDIIFSNAALHWLDDHGALFPRLLARASETGLLAVQMPDSFDYPAHTALAETAAKGWPDAQLPPERRRPVLEAAVYRSLLQAAPRIAIWRTEYLQVLEGTDAVFRWVRETAMRPYLAKLPPSARTAFEAACRDRLAELFPPEPGGATLMPFRRLFIVAARK